MACQENFGFRLPINCQSDQEISHHIAF